MRVNMSEYYAVEKVAKKFVESVSSGNIAPTNDTVSIDPGYSARIDVIDIEKTVIIVHVLKGNWGGHINFSDYLMIIKMDGV